MSPPQKKKTSCSILNCTEHMYIQHIKRAIISNLFVNLCIEMYIRVSEYAAQSFTYVVYRLLHISSNGIKNFILNNYFRLVENFISSLLCWKNYHLCAINFQLCIFNEMRIMLHTSICHKM